MPLQPSAFLETIIAFLLPYFSAAAVDANAARSEIMETLAAYATRTRAEMMHAAQIIAFGMSTLDVLAEAKSTEMSLSMRNRYRGCANGLNRSCIQHEAALTKRLACELPVIEEPATEEEPVNDLPDAEAQGMLQAAQAAIASYRSRLSPHATKEDRNMHLSAGAMALALEQMGLPPNGGHKSD